MLWPMWHRTCFFFLRLCTYLNGCDLKMPVFLSVCRPVSVHMQLAYSLLPSVPFHIASVTLYTRKRTGGGNRTAHVAQMPFLPEMPQVIQQKVCCSTNVAPVRLIEHLKKKKVTTKETHNKETHLWTHISVQCTGQTTNILFVWSKKNLKSD